MGLSVGWSNAGRTGGNLLSSMAILEAGGEGKSGKIGGENQPGSID